MNYESLLQFIKNALYFLGAWHLIKILTPLYGQAIALICAFSLAIVYICLQVLSEKQQANKK